MNVSATTRTPAFSAAAVLVMLSALASSAGAAVVTSPAKPASAAASAATPQAGTRTIYMLRHGQYDQHDPRDEAVGKGLTELGREQARRAGVRFAALPVKVNLLYASPLTRARETAEIAAAVMGMKPVTEPDLAECTPPTIRSDIMAGETPGALDSCRLQLERDFERFFRPTLGPDSTILLVAHGNVIRYLASRSIGLDPKLWLNLSFPHGSIAMVRVRPDRSMQLHELGDIGHLPPELVSYVNPPADSTGTRH
jgi:serine/threonine-protein phosphatase PGAM5